MEDNVAGFVLIYSWEDNKGLETGSEYDERLPNKKRNTMLQNTDWISDHAASPPQ